MKKRSKEQQDVGIGPCFHKEHNRDPERHAYATFSSPHPFKEPWNQKRKTISEICPNVITPPNSQLHLL